MSVAAVAAAGTAVALWLYNRRQSGLDWEEGEVATHKGAHKAPQTIMEDIYYFAEGLRRDPPEHVNTEIALAGDPFGTGMDAAAVALARRDLREIKRVFQYCMGMRERRAGPQRAYFSDALGIEEDAILAQEVRAGVLKPSFILVRDEAIGAIVLIIRGTHSFKDMFTSLTGASKPHHLVDPNGVVLGYAHFGMLAAARWVLSFTAETMERALLDHPHLVPRVVGHSLGGGTAALLTMMLRERGGVFAETRCVAVACPACMTLELSRSCSGYVTTVINRADVIPTVSPGAADRLRQEVTRSAWGGALRAELRATGLGRVIESGVLGVRSAGSWTGGKIMAACTPPRQYIARRFSGTNRTASSSGAAAGDNNNNNTHNTTLKRRVSDEGLADMVDDSLDANEEAPLLRRLRAWWVLRGAKVGDGAKLSDDEEQDDDGETAEREGRTDIRREGVTSSYSGTSSRDGVVASSSTTATITTTTTLPRGAPPPACLGTACGVQGHWRGGHDSDEGDAYRRTITRSSEDDADPLLSPRGMSMTPKDDEDEHSARTARRRIASPGPRSASPGSMARHVREASRELRFEANVRMSQVEAAVESAERSRWFGGKREQKEKDTRSQGPDSNAPTVPSVFPPGEYGSGTSGKENTAWRRALFPAGRILHLVPAHLVPKREDGFELVSVPDDDGSRLTNNSNGSGEGILDVPAEESGSETAMDSSDVKPMADHGAKEEMILLDHVPHTLYGRIRLCRDVLSDHIIPNYLASLESALERLPSSFQDSSESESDEADALELGMLDEEEPHPMMEDV